MIYLHSFVDRDMMMRYRGGGVGHTSIRDATDWFLNDRDNLDKASERARCEQMSEGNDSEQDGDSEQDDDSDSEVERRERGGDEGGSATVEFDKGKEVDDEEDIHVVQVEDLDLDEIDEELDYGYALDEEVAEESEEEYLSDDMDDALGAEDGEEAEDELDNLGFGTL